MSGREVLEKIDEKTHLSIDEMAEVKNLPHCQ